MTQIDCTYNVTLQQFFQFTNGGTSVHLVNGLRLPVQPLFRLARSRHCQYHLLRCPHKHSNHNTAAIVIHVLSIYARAFLSLHIFLNPANAATALAISLFISVLQYLSTISPIPDWMYTVTH